MQIQVRCKYIFREFPKKWNVMEATIWFNGFFWRFILTVVAQKQYYLLNKFIMVHMLIVV